MKHFCFLLALFLCVEGFLSCNKLSSEINKDYNVIKHHLSEVANNNCFINDVSRNSEGKINVIFSDNHNIIIENLDFQLVTIGLDGRWILNGIPSSYSTEENTASDVIKTKEGKEGMLFALSEAYEDWTFHFIGQSPITIKKTIYSEDFDNVMLSINHRGHSALAPENTLPAFRLARLKGFRYVETDVRFTSDNVPVLLHDDSIDRTSNGTGKIGELTLSQALQYDFGSWKSDDFSGTQIPSLYDFLLLCKSIGLHPVLELKIGTKEQISLIVDMVEKLGLADDTIYISFSSTLLGRLLEKRPSSVYAFLTSKIDEKTFSTILSFKSVNIPILNTNQYDDESIEKCQELNIPLWVWVINSEDKILSLPSFISAVTSDKIHAGRLKKGIN